MLTQRQLGLTASVLLLCLFATNLAVLYLTRNSVPRRVMRHARESQNAKVLALGNSLMAAGLDESEFNTATGLTAAQGIANVSLGASSPVEQLLLFRYSLAHGIRPRLLIYGFYDLQLTQPTRLTINDIIGNRAMLYYDEPKYARQFYSLSPHDSIEFTAMHGLPMFADRGAIWAKVELLRRKMAQQGMPVQSTNQFGRAADFSLLEPADAVDFQHECEEATKQPLASPIEELLSQAQQANISISIVEMPMRSPHRARFYQSQAWTNYIAHVQNLMSPFHVTFVDASDWIQDDALFADPLHLSTNGADVFSQRIGRLLGPELAQSSENQR